MAKEISILKECNSDYIVKYRSSYYSNNSFWLIIEYCSVGSIIDLIRITNKTLSEGLISNILYLTLQGLEYLHENQIIHRDIKVKYLLFQDNIITNKGWEYFT